MASWNNQSQQPASGGRPTANPLGGSLTRENIQLKRLTPKSTDPTTLIKSAFEFVKENPLETAVVPIGLFVVLMIAQQVVSLPLNFIVRILASKAGEALGDAGVIVAMVMTIGVSFLIQIVSTVLMTALLGGINILWLRVIRGQSVTLNDITTVKPFILPLIFTAILMQLAIVGGFLLLIVPGIMLSLGLPMAQYIVIDKNLKPVDALKASWELMDGRKMEFFIFAIIISVMNFVGMLAFCVGMLLTYAISIGAMAMFYDAIAEPGNAYGNDIGNAPDVFS